MSTLRRRDAGAHSLHDPDGRKSMLRQIVRTSFFGLAASWAVVGGAAISGGNLWSQEAGRLNWPSRVMDTNRVGEVSPIATGVAIRPIGTEVAIVGDDHIVRLVDATDGRLLRTLPGHQDWIRTIAFSPDGLTLLTAGSDRRILRWDLAAERWSLFASEEASIEGIAYSADGNWVAAVGFESSLRLYDARTGQKKVEIPCSCADLRAVAFSDDGQYLAAGGRSGQLLVWERRGEGWQALELGETHQQRIQAIAFLAGGRLVSVGEDRQVCITEIGAASRTSVIATLPGKLYSLAVLSPNVIAVGGSDNRIAVIDIERKAKIGYLDGHRGTISGLAFRDGRLISGSYDGEARVWQADSALTVAMGELPGRGAAGVGAAFDLSEWQHTATRESGSGERAAGGPGVNPPLLPIRAVR